MGNTPKYQKRANGQAAVWLDNFAFNTIPRLTSVGACMPVFSAEKMPQLAYEICSKPAARHGWFAMRFLPPQHSRCSGHSCRIGCRFLGSVHPE